MERRLHFGGAEDLANLPFHAGSVSPGRVRRSMEMTHLGNNVGLGAAADGSDIDGGMSQQRMAALTERLGVGGFEGLDGAGHPVDRVDPEMRCGAMRAPPAGPQFQPHVPLWAR